MSDTEKENIQNSTGVDTTTKGNTTMSPLAVKQPASDSVDASEAKQNDR